MTAFISSLPSAAELDTLDDKALAELLCVQVEHCWRHAYRFHPDMPMPPVWLDLRGKSAGQAHFGRGGLRFNPILYRDHRHAFLAEVVPHEFAHWVVHHVYGSRVRPHGWQWQVTMREMFGLEPRVTHRFDTRKASPAPFVYRCECREHHFSSRRHHHALRGTPYRCRSCKVWLEFVGKTDELT
ncbi:SprT family zinc-dependent metalloprotease [Phytohalomonas tamaricis]|uniref:SprT family zinc-dependent metalloprotease n=1 Tax=Phytohalomonas tamaricis TaxID=2081032 RepID=UPI000D0AD1ED|nr:SprT-like domain-containing protein [Phytohalomonas tamaricis]